MLLTRPFASTWTVNVTKRMVQYFHIGASKLSVPTAGGGPAEARKGIASRVETPTHPTVATPTPDAVSGSRDFFDIRS